MEPVQVEFTYTAQTFLRLRRLMLWRFFTTGWVKWVYLALVLLWLMKLVLQNAWTSFFISLASVAIVLAVWWWLFSWMTNRTYHQTAALKHPIRYVFSPQEIHLNTQNAEAVLQWNTFQKAEELPEFFLLYQNKAMANPVMKAGFANQNDMERFRNILIEKKLL